LEKHLGNLRAFGVPAVVAINRFPKDTGEELSLLQAFCQQQGVASAISDAFSKGGEGAATLAAEVVRTIETNQSPSVRSAYSASDSVERKISKIAQVVYGAADVEYSQRAKDQLAQFCAWGYRDLPVCIAKTQYSLSDNPKLLEAPVDWTLHISDVKLSAGAGFLIPVAGSAMLMPGLPKEPRAFEITVDEGGEIVGLL